MKNYFGIALLTFAIIFGLSACNQPGNGNADSKDTSSPAGKEKPATSNDAAKSNLPGLDKSPMDMSYYPVGYSSDNVQGKAGKLVARVIYSRPQMNGREIFGKLVPYDKVWRLGANQATELDIFAPVSIGGHALQPGRYTLYAIPETDKWTIVLSSQTDIWGAFGYQQDKDILRTVVPVTTLSDAVEAFSLVFEKADQGCNLIIAWDKTEVRLPISF